MAEGGGSDSDENPFSFKNYLQPKDENKPSKQGKARENRPGSYEANLPDISRTSRKKEKKVSTKEEPVKKTKEVNPFSFKKFLANSGETSTKRTKSAAKSSIKTPDFATDLPDFVQDHYGETTSNRPRANSRDAMLPDFGLPSNSIGVNDSGNHDFPGFVSEGSRKFDGAFPDVGLPTESSYGRFRSNSDPEDIPDVNDIPIASGNPELNNTHSDSEDSEFLPLTDTRPVQRSVKPVNSVLPDFLSDGVHKNSENFSDSDFLSPSTDEGFRNGFLDSEDTSGIQEENRRLREEVERLRQQLDQANMEILAETERKHKMKRDMEVIQKKEAEETAALERMVQQVEANLTTTTQRAVTAENTASRLQSEVKSLQSQVTRLRSENEALRAGDHGMADLRERTSYASKQLASAATTAEQNLKQLLSGVDNLKILAQVLESIDKFSEPRDNTNNSKKKGRDT